MKIEFSFDTVAFAVTIITLAYAQIRNNQKTEIMWKYLFERSLVKAVNAGLGKMESPFQVNNESHITAKVRAAFEPLKPRLIDYWKTRGSKLSASKAAFEIQAKFGTEIVKDVCLKTGLYNGECLVIALAIASGQDVIETGIP